MRPLPLLTPENTAFWTGGETGELKITFCKDCEHAIHPPQLMCPKCWSAKVEARAVAGTGVVYSYTINHQPWMPGMQVPFALGVVDVDGAPGVRVSAQMVDVDVTEVHIGMQVRATFLNVEDVWVPQWTPEGEVGQ